MRFGLCLASVSFAVTCLAAACSGDDGGGSSGTGTETDGGTGGTAGTDSATGSTSGATDSGSSGGGTGGSSGSTGGSTGGLEGDTVRVLYRPDAEGEGTEPRIMAVDLIDGVAQTPVVVTAPFTGDEVLSGIQRSSPDRRWYTYEVVSNSNGSRDLYAVDVGGPSIGTPVRVSGAPVPEPGIVVDSTFSADGSLLAFVASGDLSGGHDVYLVPMGGATPGTAVRINPDTTPNDGVLSPDFSDDGTRILYAGSIDDGIENVYMQSADPDNPGTPVLVSNNADGNVSVGAASWLANDDWVLYRSDVDADGVSEVFVVDVSGGTPGTPIALDPSDSLTVRGPGMAPDMRGYAFWMGDGTSGDMFYASFDGGAFGTPELVSILGMGNEVFAKEFFWTPDSNWLFYEAEHETAGVRELYAVDMSGNTPAAPVKVNGTLLATTEVNVARPSPEGQHVYYFAAQDTMNQELYRAALSVGSIGAPERVHSQTIHDSTELMFNGEDAVLFTGNLDGGDVMELFMTDLTTMPLGTVTVNAPTSDGVRFGARRTRDERFVAYELATLTREIMVVDLEGAGPGTAVQAATGTAFGPDQVIHLQ